MAQGREHMTLHQLRIFSAVAKHLNVTKASEELHITQPAVSRQLRLLCEDCGAGLYKVTSRGIELTEEGQLLLRSAEPILTQIERIKNAFGKGKKCQTLRLGGSQSPSLSFLPLVSAICRRMHPEVQIVIRTDTSHAVEQLVLKSEVEIAVITAPSFTPSLIYEHCRQEKLVAFASPKHPLCKKQKLAISELSRVPLIVKRRGQAGDFQSEEVLRQLEKRGIAPNIVIECDSPWAVKAAVKAGVGIAILYRDMVESDLQQGDLKIIKITDLKMEQDSYIVYPKDRPLSVNAQEFLTLLRHQLSKTRCTIGQLKLAKVVEYR